MFAGDALAFLQDPSAVPDLVKALRDRNSRVRDMAASALPILAEDSSALRVLLAVLHGQNATARRLVCGHGAGCDLQVLHEWD
jgi:HEAT repeat protein